LTWYLDYKTGGQAEMWRREKFIFVALLAAVVLVGSTACSSCAPAGGGDEELPGPPEDMGPPERMAPPEDMAPPEGVPGEFPYEASMAGVAEIVGIDQQKLEDAFAQARSEMQDEGLGARQPEALMARIAEILGIDQQQLEDGFAQVRNEMPDQGPWQRRANGNGGPWGANEE
jgi:hypothetical protein